MNPIAIAIVALGGLALAMSASSSSSSDGGDGGPKGPLPKLELHALSPEYVGSLVGHKA